MVDPLNPRQEGCNDKPVTSSSTPPTITLEVPLYYGKCLSPIREVASPLPTPAPSPSPSPRLTRMDNSQSLESYLGSDSSLSIGSSVSRSSSLRKLVNRFVANLTL